MSAAWNFNFQMHFAGIFCGIFVRRLGPRIIIIFGGFIASLGVFLSAFATNIPTLYVTFGVIAGLYYHNNFYFITVQSNKEVLDFYLRNGLNEY